MVAPRIIAAELLKKRVEKAKSKVTHLNQAEFHVIGSNCRGFKPCLLVISEGCSYLFNCHEGFQRLSYANRIKILSLENAFLTNNDWNNVSGAFGLSLTLQDIGCPSFTLRGSEGVYDLFDATKTFMTFNSGIKTRTLSHLDGDFQDSGLTVIPIAIESHRSSDHDDNFERKRSKNETKLISYACLMPDLPGKLDAQKCRELKVPIGPRLALLKNGLDVILDDGRLIKSSDVCGPKDQGLYFVIIECPTVEQIDNVIRNDRLTNLKNRRKPNDERQINMVIHFSPENVIEHSKYQQWMNSFPDDCKHLLMIHSESNFLNLLDSYRYLYMYRQLDSEIFPELHLPNFARDSIEKELNETKSIVETNLLDLESEMEPVLITSGSFGGMNKIVKAQAFDKITIRPNRGVDCMKRKYAFDGYFRIAKMHPEFEEEFEKHKQNLKTMPSPQVFEPQLIFLGTGSAVPSKLRNTTCILLNFEIPKEVSVILDCGEDSYGQLVRYYGPEQTKKVLKRLKMIYVSHHHADHHIGLIRLLKERANLTDEPIILLLPPGVDTLLNYHNTNFENLSRYYRIYSTKTLKSLPSMPLETTNQLKELKRDLIKELDGLIDDFTIVGVNHCIDSCAAVFSFNISRPGMSKFKLAYSGDARPSADFIQVAKGCDLLIHEATFDHRSTADAITKKHSTTNEAIGVGQKMEAKFTILTHFSQRYAKIPYFTEKFDDKVGFAFDYLTLKCPSHFSRLPILKDILKLIHDGALQDIDTKHTKKELKQKILNEFAN